MSRRRPMTAPRAARPPLLRALVLTASLLVLWPAGAVAAPSRVAQCSAQLEAPAPTASAQPGSAGAGVLAQFSVLRRAAVPVDGLLGTHLATAVTAGGATAYDPARARLLVAADGVLEFLVPATLPVADRLASCDGTVLQSAAVAIRTAEQLRGHGPGVCLISTTWTATCESLAVLDGYGGIDAVVTGPLLAPEFLVPDGVADVSMVYANGRTDLVPVFDNLALPPQRLQLPSGLSSSGLATLLSASLPTAVSWQGSRNRVFHRPPALLGALQAALGAALS